MLLESHVIVNSISSKYGFMDCHYVYCLKSSGLMQFAICKRHMIIECTTNWFTCLTWSFIINTTAENTHIHHTRSKQKNIKLINHVIFIATINDNFHYVSHCATKYETKTLMMIMIISMRCKYNTN